MISRLIVGLFLVIVSMSLFFLSIFFTKFLLIYAIPLFILGILILFNDNEDRIEQRNDLKGGKNEKNNSHNRK